MKLFYSATSPYARKVRILIYKLGLNDKIELLVTDPWSEENLREINPLCKVPTLLLDDNTALFDSPVICEYISAQAKDNIIFPPIGKKRWQALCLQALSDGLCDSAVRIVLEGRRPEAERSNSTIARQQIAIDSALAEVEKTIGLLNKELTIGELSLAAALGYLELRFANSNWQASQPKLAEWFENINKQPFMINTKPV